MTGHTILFICTGNIFRSMTADFALTAALGPDSGHRVSSAGLLTPPHGVLPFVEDYLTNKGIDISAHQPTKLTPAILDQATLAIAMSTDHQAQIAQDFDRKVPLFSKIAYNTTQPLRDVDEVVPDWRIKHQEAITYGRSVMDYIFEGMPGVISQLSSAPKC